ncbi:MAG: 16S rRNA (uracil(1498)-N(3))-methyltransferase, partial [Bacteroidales bacterium]|nr:16S rRNA (uracil(1498)-N(3))-methyltransferase [Bacteroidales bacterium]
LFHSFIISLFHFFIPSLFNPYQSAITMHIFYSPHILENTSILSPEESAHCLRVLRLGKGDKVTLIDGKGGMYEAEIAEPVANACRLEITAILPSPPERKHKIHIAIAPTKSIDRFEWFVEKSVEIGIDSITPILCQRSERRVLKTDRLQKLIIATIKQAMVPRLPVLNELTPFEKLAKDPALPHANRFIAHCQAGERRELKNEQLAACDTIILIGPEGDFAPGELDLAKENQLMPVSLGYNRLRTETAGIVACCMFNAQSGNSSRQP